jgi:hypothetical protein
LKVEKKAQALKAEKTRLANEVEEKARLAAEAEENTQKVPPPPPLSLSFPFSYQLRPYPVFSQLDAEKVHAEKAEKTRLAKEAEEKARLAKESEDNARKVPFPVAYALIFIFPSLTPRPHSAFL